MSATFHPANAQAAAAAQIQISACARSFMKRNPEPGHKVDQTVSAAVAFDSQVTR